ncbi:MAG TPA: transcriptional regulator [Jiangellaceae bacterium]
MTLDALDPVIHAPKRLATMAVLANSTSASFGFLREHLGISDSDLSKQMTTLEKAGYIKASKTRGPGGTTTYQITKEGAAAYRRHLAALRAIVGTGE